MPSNARGASHLLRRSGGHRLAKAPRRPVRASDASSVVRGIRQRKFAEELRRRRVLAGLSQRELADAAFVSRELVTKVEAGRRWPDRRFAQAAELLLGGSAELMVLWSAGDAERTAERRREAVADQIERLRTSVGASGDAHLRLILQAATVDPAQVVTEVVAAAVVALGEVVTNGLDGTLAVQRVGELERRVAGYELGDLGRDGLAGVCQLALDVADATQLAAQLHGHALRSNISMLVERMRRVLAAEATSLGLADIAAVWFATPSEGSELPYAVIDAPPCGELPDDASAANRAVVDDGSGPAAGGRGGTVKPRWFTWHGLLPWRGAEIPVADGHEGRTLCTRSGGSRRRRRAGPWGEGPRVRGPSRRWDLPNVVVAAPPTACDLRIASDSARSLRRCRWVRPALSRCSTRPAPPEQAEDLRQLIEAGYDLAL